MAVPAPDSGVLKRIYANLVGPGGLISLDIPDRILERLYTYGSLKDTDDGAQFEIKNRLQDAKVTGVSRVFVDGERVPLEDIRLVTADGKVYELDSVDEDNYVNFPVGRTVIVQVDGVTVTKGKHNIEIDFEAAPFGDLTLDVTDTIRSEEMVGGIPRDSENNYAEDAIQARHEYLKEETGAEMEHVGQCSIDPEVTEWNVENFIGVAQMPIGVAGPVKINGEHADSEYQPRWRRRGAPSWPPTPAG
jgi:hydroxymethylglutaryl-CoA reductase (NADPH)